MEEETEDVEISKTGQIFTELAGEVRRSMLFKLKEKSFKLSELSRALDITIQHAHSNINRLTKVGLVSKSSSSALSLTTYGRTIVNQLPTFQFLGEHKDYFQDHTFGDLPLKFERRIGDLNNCSVVRGVVAVIQKWKVMYQNAGEYINSIIPQVPVDLIEPLAAKIKGGAKFSYILPEDAIYPRGTSEATKRAGWKFLLVEGKAERKMVSKMPVATIVTDKSACVLFPSLKKGIDLDAMFYSEDPVFREWCQDYFRYMWYVSGLFNAERLKHEI